MSGTGDFAFSTWGRSEGAGSDAVRRIHLDVHDLAFSPDRQAVPTLDGDPVCSRLALFLDVIVGLSDGCTVVRM